MNTNKGVSDPTFKEKENESRGMSVVNIGLLLALIITMGANQVFLNSTNAKLGIKDVAGDIFGNITGKNGKQFAVSANASKELTGDIGKDAISLVISSGVPEVYGKELGVSFDQVQQSMNVMRQFDPYDLKPGGKRIIPEGENLKRYSAIGTKISCEYCCGAKAIIFANGKTACGCAHAMAMRGLAAYLLQNHGGEYTDDQILKELAKWKGMYFPKQMIKKVAGQLQSGSYTPDVSAILLGAKLPDYGKGDKQVPLPSEIENLPGMVGGCS
ncbi:MAG: hypothetical protein WC788_06835 [Candidatus Paceibacterota bacterium]|jgi:hypothetical protein